MVVFFTSAFMLLAVKDFNVMSISMVLIVPLIFLVSTVLIPKLFPADRLLLSLVNFLCALGVLMLYRMDPQKGFNQAINYGVGVLAMVAMILLVRHVCRWDKLIWLVVLGSIAFMATPLLFGTERYGAQAWVTVAGISIQPSEVVKIALLLVEAYLLSKRKVLAAILYAGICLGFLMLQKDLGTALVFYATAFIMLLTATGSLVLLGLGTVGAAVGGAVGYTMFSHVKKRVRIWINPWIDYRGDGYQIVQSLIAMVNGGPWGVGLGAGNAYDIPAYTTDFIFAVVMNEFGLIFGVVVILLFVALFLRGIGIALQSQTRFHMLLSLGAASIIIVQTFIIIGGNIKMIPLTGVTLPFISYGGTSLMSSMAILGLAQGVDSVNKSQLKEDEMLAIWETDAYEAD